MKNIERKVEDSSESRGLQATTRTVAPQAALSSAARTFGATPAAAEDKSHQSSAVGEQQVVVRFLSRHSAFFVEKEQRKMPERSIVAHDLQHFRPNAGRRTESKKSRKILTFRKKSLPCVHKIKF